MRLQFVVAALLASACALLPRHVATMKGADVKGPYSFVTKPTTYTLDHFDFSPHAPGNLTTFQSKYLINDTWWVPGKGPIFFYTGNEGPIELFAQNTGFMWDIAPEFNALLVFAEHRYYGSSMPFGNETYKDPKSGTLQWLTAEQALADYANLIVEIKATLPGAANAPVVAFGGSYGGMLTAWFRMKYPGVVNGGIAASAPILQFTGLASDKSYSHVVSNTFQTANPACAAGLQSSWDVMAQLGQTDAGRSTLTQAFRLCKPLVSPGNVTTSLFNFVNTAMQYMAMADYPAPASFLGPMPAWPVNASCAGFPESPTQPELLDAVRRMTNVYYNYSGQAGLCFDIDVSGPSTLQDAGGWDYQSCTEMVMPIGQYGPPNDILYPAPWNLSDTLAGCEATYDVVPRPQWIPTSFNGRNLQGVSNLVLSNGNLDPWSGGGVTQNITGATGITAVLIHKGAHHLDLRASTPNDPPEVVLARNIHREHIRQWVL